MSLPSAEVEAAKAAVLQDLGGVVADRLRTATPEESRILRGLILAHLRKQGKITEDHHEHLN